MSSTYCKMLNTIWLALSEFLIFYSSHQQHLNSLLTKENYSSFPEGNIYAFTIKKIVIDKSIIFATFLFLIWKNKKNLIAFNGLLVHFSYC